MKSVTSKSEIQDAQNFKSVESYYGLIVGFYDFIVRRASLQSWKKCGMV